MRLPAGIDKTGVSCCVGLDVLVLHPLEDMKSALQLRGEEGWEGWGGRLRSRGAERRDIEAGSKGHERRGSDKVQRQGAGTKGKGWSKVFKPAATCRKRQ